VTTFVDTSALLAVLDANETRHGEAARQWTQLVESEEAMVTTNYVLVETFAIVQRRLGMEAVRALEDGLLPWIATRWIDALAHREAVAAFLTSSRRGLSLVDCASFGAMRALGIQRAFTLDADFDDQGFEQVP
jgi:predicted nucleic acid-binding protein